MSDKDSKTTNVTLDELDDFSEAAGTIFTKSKVSLESPEVAAAVEAIEISVSEPQTENEIYEASERRLSTYLNKGWIVLREGDYQILLSTEDCTPDQFHRWVKQVYPPATTLETEGKMKVADWDTSVNRNKAIQYISNKLKRHNFPAGSMSTNIV